MENSKTACYPCKILITSFLQEVALYERFQLEGFDLEYVGVLDVK